MNAPEVQMTTSGSKPLLVLRIQPQVRSLLRLHWPQASAAALQASVLRNIWMLLMNIWAEQIMNTVFHVKVCAKFQKAHPRAAFRD